MTDDDRRAYAAEVREYRRAERQAIARYVADHGGPAFPAEPGSGLTQFDWFLGMAIVGLAAAGSTQADLILERATAIAGAAIMQREDAIAIYTDEVEAEPIDPAAEAGPAE